MSLLKRGNRRIITGCFVFHFCEKKKKDNCFPRENVLTEVTSRNRKKPEVAGSLTSGCVKAALQLFVLLFFIFSLNWTAKKVRILQFQCRCRCRRRLISQATLPYPLSEKVKTLLIQIPLNFREHLHRNPPKSLLVKCQPSSLRSNTKLNSLLYRFGFLHALSRFLPLVGKGEYTFSSSWAELLQGSTKLSLHYW